MSPQQIALILSGFFAFGWLVSSLAEVALRYYERGQKWERPSRREWRRILAIGAIGSVVGMLFGPDSLSTIIQGGLAVPVTIRILRLMSSRAGSPGAVDRLERAERAAQAEPDKAQPLSEVSGARLEVYFERNLIQLRLVYLLTIAVLVGGFVLIGYGVFKAFQPDIKLEAAGLATAAGVLTEFVGATVLVVFRSTLAQASSFAKALERINAFGMAAKLVESIPESAGEMRQRAKARLALGIVASVAISKPDSQSSDKEKNAPSTAE